jgi:hypothetical protein
MGVGFGGKCNNLIAAPERVCRNNCRMLLRSRGTIAVPLGGFSFGL